MEGSESMIQDKAFMALVLMRTSGSLRTLINCSGDTHSSVSQCGVFNFPMITGVGRVEYLL